MKSMRKLTPFVVVALLNGCATYPAGPSVRVLPGEGKSFETFQSDDATCRHWAQQQTGISPQQAHDQNLATGAVAGTAIGAGLGAALGAISGHAGAGAAVGAASGLLVGSAAGSDSSRFSAREAQKRYDNAYVQCMYSYGNQVPGNGIRVAAAPKPAAVPPPPPDLPSADTQYSDVPPAPEQYPAPPEVYVNEAPRFIYSPSLNTYVAVGVPYDLMYTGSEYFYFYGGRWYRGPYYNGPWVIAPRNYYPPALLSYRIGSIRQYRDLEFRRYEHDRAHYNGRFYRPEFRRERRG